LGRCSISPPVRCANVNVDLKWHVIRAARVATAVRKHRTFAERVANRSNQIDPKRKLLPDTRWTEFTAGWRAFLTPRARRGFYGAGDPLEKILNTDHTGYCLTWHPANVSAALS
jgi:hypothetical protein